MATRTFLLLFVATTITFSKADVPQLRGRIFAARSQRQQLAANPTPYPARGFRPDRQFSLPQDQSAPASDLLPSEQTLQRPDQLYGAPARQQFLPQQQQQPQRTYAAPVEAAVLEPAPVPAIVTSQRLIAQPARLTSNREDREDEDESRTDIEVETNVEEKKVVDAAQPAPAPTTTIAYYPAGAVSFVHPFSAAAYSLPAQVPIYAKIQAQQAAFTSAVNQVQPQVLAQPQFLQW